MTSSPSRAGFLSVTFELRQAETDVLVAEGWSAGMLGCVAEAPDRLTIYFTDDGSDPAAGMNLRDGVREIRRRRIDDQDWLRLYRESVAPIAVGDRWLLDPREPGQDTAPVKTGGRTLLRLPARRAFGTGGHESTRLALRLLESTDVSGRRVLDFGYGSGVLAFAAARLEAASCVAVERDLTAALIGGLNRRLNAMPQPVRMIAATAASLSNRCRFDLLLVNVRPVNWWPERSRLAAALAGGAEIICSGMLTGELDDLLPGCERMGWRPVDHIEENEWSGVRMRVTR